MEERARIPVELPCLGPTKSYWQSPAAAIADHRTTEALPSAADFVVIGSGISGSLIAYNILCLRPLANVVLLEAREACSGATGRNGGHTKAASYRSFLDHERELGTTEAVKIARMELASIRATHAFAREHDMGCASCECDTVDVIYSQAHLELGKTAINRMKAVMGEDPAAQYDIFDASETERFLTPGALGSFKYAAGSINAYAFAIGVLRLALRKRLNLQTHTAALSLTRATDATWTVTTSRGHITAPQVIVAANGYTAKLLPQMQGLIVPLQGQVVAQRPGLSLPVLEHTYSFVYETGYEYMISRPTGTADARVIIIGGGIHQLSECGVSRYGCTDDTSLEPTITAYLRDRPGKNFGSYWGDDHRDKIKQEWSGIMGATADGLPYVGQMPDMPGTWISAGFNGHGMVLCLKAAVALVDMMLGDQAVQVRTQHWFPQSMLPTKARLARRFYGRKDLRAPGEAQFGNR